MSSAKGPELLKADDALKARKALRQARIEAINDWVAFAATKATGVALTAGGIVDYFVHFASVTQSYDVNGVGIGLAILGGPKLREWAMKVLKP